VSNNENLDEEDFEMLMQCLVDFMNPLGRMLGDLLMMMIIFQSCTKNEELSENEKFGSIKLRLWMTFMNKK